MTVQQPAITMAGRPWQPMRTARTATDEQLAQAVKRILWDAGTTKMTGPDLVWRGDRWQTSPAASADKELRRAPNFDVLARNVYKVLLTRGLIGCVIYATNPETRALLAKLGVPPA
jgi:Uncharacterized conserved protein (DUF2075)